MPARPPPVHWYGAIEGLLKWTVPSGDGRSVTLGGLSAGSWFGEGTLLRGTPRTADVIALRPSRVAVTIPRQSRGHSGCEPLKAAVRGR